MRCETPPEVDFLTAVSIGLIAIVLVSGCWVIYASVLEAMRLRRWERSLGDTVKVTTDGDPETVPLLGEGSGRSGTSKEEGEGRGRGGWKDDGIKAARVVYGLCVFTVSLRCLLLVSLCTVCSDTRGHVRIYPRRTLFFFDFAWQATC